MDYWIDSEKWRVAIEAAEAKRPSGVGRPTFIAALKKRMDDALDEMHDAMLVRMFKPLEETEMKGLDPKAMLKRLDDALKEAHPLSALTEPMALDSSRGLLAMLPRDDARIAADYSFRVKQLMSAKERDRPDYGVGCVEQLEAARVRIRELEAKVGSLSRRIGEPREPSVDDLDNYARAVIQGLTRERDATLRDAQGKDQHIANLQWEVLLERKRAAERFTQAQVLSALNERRGEPEPPKVPLRPCLEPTNATGLDKVPGYHGRKLRVVTVGWDPEGEGGL